MPDEDATTETAADEPSGRRGWRNVPTRYIIAALVAFSTFCMSAKAYLSPNETSARKSYDTLAAALESEAKATAQNHDDIVNLRGYIEGYVKTREQPQPLAVESAQPPPNNPNAPVPPPHTVLKVSPLVKPPPPPPLGSGSPPPRFQAPSYEHVTGKSDLPF